MSHAAAKPIPVPDEASAPFFDGARRGELMLLRCARCGRWCHPVRERCPHCLAAALEWRAASGEGTLYTFAVMHQVMHPGFAADVPYNVCQIDLDEGLRMVANITGIANDALRIGMRVRVVFEAIGPDVSIPKFQPVAT